MARIFRKDNFNLKACIIPFFDYQQGNSDLLWKFFLVHSKKWGKYVDKIYVIDSGVGINQPNDPKIQIIKKPAQSHWQNMNEVIREIPADTIILLDSDMIIYSGEKFKAILDRFDKEELDGLGIFDSAGAKSLPYEIMQENENRLERRRFCPYFFILKKSALRENFDFTPRGTPNWTDSMGVVTEQLLEDGKKIGELPDDRSTISLEEDGTITSTQWLDALPKKWALKENPDYGYYHIRNFGGGLKIYKDQSFELVPSREANRLLAWFRILAEITGTNINTLLFSEDFEQYYNLFKQYHHWLYDLGLKPEEDPLTLY